MCLCTAIPVFGVVGFSGRVCCCLNITSSVGVEVLVTSSLDHSSQFLFVVLLHTSLGRLKMEYDCQTENSVLHVPFFEIIFFNAFEMLSVGKAGRRKTSIIFPIMVFV